MKILRAQLSTNTNTVVQYWHSTFSAPLLYNALSIEFILTAKKDPIIGYNLF